MRKYLKTRSPNLIIDLLMNVEHGNKCLENDTGQTVKYLAKKLGINKRFLSGYLRALGYEGHVKSKRIGPAKVHFKGSVEE